MQANYIITPRCRRTDDVAIRIDITDEEFEYLARHDQQHLVLIVDPHGDPAPLSSLRVGICVPQLCREEQRQLIQQLNRALRSLADTIAVGRRLERDRCARPAPVCGRS